MALSESDRAALGVRIKAQRERVFNTKKDAYQEAGLNAATWDKAEAGETLRPDRLRIVVKTLWPESEGDWTAIPSSAVAEADALAELRAEVADLRERLRRLEETG